MNCIVVLQGFHQCRGGHCPTTSLTLYMVYTNRGKPAPLHPHIPIIPHTKVRQITDLTTKLIQMRKGKMCNVTSREQSCSLSSWTHVPDKRMYLAFHFTLFFLLPVLYSHNHCVDAKCHPSASCDHFRHSQCKLTREIPNISNRFTEESPLCINEEEFLKCFWQADKHFKLTLKP